ncbi:MAG: NapC/NirT family cytochrome c, partial [candidate division Zixibacteria bacterium]|nr:NapC/NirT family cytochrome c [candidate division Zixibacteria bacterium]
AIFTLANIIILGAASSRMLAYMDEPEFCGTACHSVMNPEWVTYQQSPHARVKCVQCHVGEGVDALVDSKLNGIWQMISVTFDLLERPIPTPVHNLRPARETCEKCHWPEKFYGSRLVTNVRYDSDSASTPRYATLNLKVDAGYGTGKAGIHWHVAAENVVRYASLNDQAEEMIWVEARRPDGSFNRYVNRSLAGVATEKEQQRTFDCIDCHNRATHIYERPQDAVDRLLRAGHLDRSLPFIKREALTAITGNYADNDAAEEGIANSLTAFYRQHFPDVARRRMMGIDSAIAALQAVYARNIFHSMNITWGTYPSHIGHVGDGGCFRCHNGDMVDTSGSSISSDCTLCHSILAFNDEEPFKYLRATDTTSAEAAMQEYLRQEFLDYIGE